jgi:Zn2+/Cd2+-exporting ATPase
MTQTPSLKTQQMQIGGMDCTSCKMKIEGGLERLKGVNEASVTVSTGRLVVSYNPDQVSAATIQTKIKALGYTIAADYTRDHHDPNQPNCDHNHNPSHNHSHNPSHNSSHSHPSDNDNHLHDRVATTRDSEHEHSHGHEHGAGEFNFKQELPSLLLTIVLFTIGTLFETPLHNTPYSLAEFAIMIPAYLLAGWTILTTAGKNIRRGQMFDENFLMTIASLGAIAIHQLPEAVAVMLFFRFGELFQEYSVGRSRRSIKALLAIRPDQANLSINGTISAVAPDTVQVGATILIRPGEKVPLDGEILTGTSQVDAAALTGESVPRVVRVGDPILAGMINQSGVLTVRVTKLFGESSIVKILDLVENASSKKAATEKFITKFARAYTPIVVFLSLALAVLPPLFIRGSNPADWLYRALILLVISCPCGLVISIPLGYFGGIGGAAKRGILIKGSTFLDRLTAVKTVVFDKTGTLTAGSFNVTQIEPQPGFTEADLLRLAAHAEVHSHHPIAQSIRRAYVHPIDPADVSDYAEIAGQGIRAKVDHQMILVGNDRLLQQAHIAPASSDVIGTIVHLAVDRQYAGYIAIADTLKADAIQAIRALKQLGVTQVIMLTGDNEATAQQVSRQLGLDGYRANLLPEDKVAAIEEFLDTSGQQQVIFVGDGINDAPVIARADVGMAMGALGSDAAIETADVVLMTDAPMKVAEAMQIAQKTRQIVVQNIILALAIKGLVIALGAFGLATLWEAVFADVGVALLAIVNAGRVLR